MISVRHINYSLDLRTYLFLPSFVNFKNGDGETLRDYWDYTVGMDHVHDPHQTIGPLQDELFHFPKGLYLDPRLVLEVPPICGSTWSIHF